MILEDSYKAFVNLDYRTDRLDKMERTLQKIGLEAVRQRGMTPKEWYDSHPSKEHKRVQVMQKRTPGAIGCYFSQIKIMQSALLHGKHAFVMEDDLVFCSDFPKRMKIVDDFLSGRDWDVFWLGGTFHINPPYWNKDLGRDAIVTDNPRILRTLGAFSTHAYIVNGPKIKQILTLLDGCLDTTIGIDYSFIRLQPSLQTFAFVPGMVKQYDNQSDIGKGMTRFSGFVKLGPYWWQDKMEQFDPTKFNWHEANLR